MHSAGEFLSSNVGEKDNDQTMSHPTYKDQNGNIQILNPFGHVEIENIVSQIPPLHNYTYPTPALQSNSISSLPETLVPPSAAIPPSGYEYPSHQHGSSLLMHHMLQVSVTLQMLV
ncbi:hypothetical protein VKT23_019990 [Stygiomarasmius scandens]|uniref:Uncharacterized protein n=2 Tax=Marasmiellus scandens TaxID=2682957 RepID=A0ABR1IM33_9AGAR